MEPNIETGAEMYANRQNIFQRAYWFIRAYSIAGWKYATGDDSSCPVVYDPVWDDRIYFVRADGSLAHVVVFNSDCTFMDTDGQRVELIHFGE